MNMNISILGNTKIVGILGYPISHTLSPIMHNSAFMKLGLNYIYLPFEIKEENLKKAVESIRALNLIGVNVTVPYKEKVIKYIDELSDEVKKIGAVNTILNKDGKLIGFNTDIYGFIQSFVLQKIELKNKKVMVLGCGGASRSVCFGLFDNNISSLFITDIISKKAKKLKNDLEKFYKNCKIQIIPMNEDIIFEEMKNIDILVNATPVGMSPNIDKSPVSKIPSDNKNLIIYDLVYNPINTKLLNIAKGQKLKTISGIEMLIYQGAKAFEIWTEHNAPVDVMRKSIIKRVNS